MHIHQGRADVFSAADGLSGDFAYPQFEDREGNIWVSTVEGLDRFRDLAVATLTKKQGLSRSLVGSILSDKNGSVWLASYGGLNRWNHGKISTPSTGGTKRDGKLNGSDPNSLFQDSKGRIWVSTLRELGYLDNGRFISIKRVPAGNVLSIAEDNASNLWMINEPLGLVRVSPQNDVRQIPWADLGHRDHASVLATGSYAWRVVDWFFWVASPISLMARSAHRTWRVTGLAPVASRTFSSIRTVFSGFPRRAGSAG